MGDRIRVVYMMLSDCRGDTHQKYPSLPDIEVEIEAFNNGSHFSQENFWILSITGVQLAIFMVFLGFTGFKLFKELSNEIHAETPLIFLAAAIVLEVYHLACEFIHLLIYSFDGDGLWILDFLNNSMQLGSQMLIIAILMLLGCGWTITYKNIFERTNYLKIGVISFLFMSICAYLSHLDNGESHKFHDFTGLPGWLLVVGRIFLFVLFIA